MPGRRQHGEGSVYHRASRNQWVAVADLGWKPGGKRDRREFTGPDPASALEKRAKFLDRRRDGFTLPRGRQPYVSEWVLFWVHHTARAQLGPTSWEAYRQKCEDLVAPYFEHVRLAELSAEDIEGWHASLLARPKQRGKGTLSPATVGMAHSIFSACLKEAARRRRIAVNPCSIVSPPTADREPPEPPSQEELDMVLERCKTWPNGARWVLAITTGLRQGEALALCWNCVRLKSPASVTVRQSQARVDGEWVSKPPKSRKSRRSVPLLAVAVRALEAHHAAQAVTDIAGRVFTRPNGQPVHRRTDWQDWQDLLADLGLPHYRVHDLRHAYATTLLEEGTDPRVVQDLMGWSSAAMAEIYQHVRPAMHARVVSRLDERFGG